MALKKRIGNSEDVNHSKMHSHRPCSSQAKFQKKTNNKRLLNSQQKEGFVRMGIPYILLIVLIGCVSGYLHRKHISHMFESDRHFSHLSTLERELAFRTEMGLYYSYYKTIVEAPTVVDGIDAVLNDNITEYPQVINVLRRFNLYPEVILAVGYRTYEKIAQFFAIQTKLCWKVNRGYNLSPVWSCEGLGEPSYFYIEMVFLLNGAMMMLFYVFGTYLSCSMLGGIVTVMFFFFNHGECTRVQWTPPLRESFAYPFFVMQMFLVTRVLRAPSPSYSDCLWIAVSTICFILPWQFAQFALLTQTVSVFGTYVLTFIEAKKIKIILIGQSLGLLISYICLFGNVMLLTSFFASCLVTSYVIVTLEPILRKLGNSYLLVIVQTLLLGAGTISIKILSAAILNVTDDAHIADILRSKFTDYKNFHTMLYTCAAEFDFLEFETLWKLMKTLLIPCSVMVILTVLIVIYHSRYVSEQVNVVVAGAQKDEKTPYIVRYQGSMLHAEIVYHIFQTLAFTMMATIIMRLKLFWTPHLCLISSLLASNKFFGWFGSRNRQLSVLGFILAGAAVQGWLNLTHQWNIIGEFSNVPQEQLVEWINTKTSLNAVFAGPMPTMATVKLCTNRPIVNHPHYEDANLRERTKKVYTLYSRKSEEEVWQNLMSLHVNFTILEESWCMRRSRKGCGMPEIWDLEDPENHNKIPVCARLHKHPEPYFRSVFQNNVYDVLEVVTNPKKT